MSGETRQTGVPPSEPSPDPLDRPAAQWLADVPWEGPGLDPDTLGAARFLERL